MMQIISSLAFLVVIDYWWLVDIDNQKPQVDELYIYNAIHSTALLICIVYPID